MRGAAKVITVCALSAAAALTGLVLLSLPDRRVEKILSGYPPDRSASGMTIDLPFDGTVFPPEIAAPAFEWHADGTAADTWLVLFRFEDGERLMFVTEAPTWKPGRSQWEKIKARCVNQPATVTVLGANRADLGKVVCSSSLSMRVSRDPVDAPIFFRDVNLPFRAAIKDPTKIRWRLGSVSSEKPPPVVLEKLPVCGNCHSFSLDGKVLGMDVDYANDKGSYVTTDVTPAMTLTKDKLMTWSDCRKEDGQQTFGLLSQVSPDGRYVISTVKDRSVFLATAGLAFSQLFFPIQGLLAVFDRQTGEFKTLPGADDPAYVQSNPVWSPDGKTIFFAKSPVYTLRNLGRKEAVLLTQEEGREFLKEGKTFQYDLYRIPFNEGQGGTAEPLKGASQNGKSNYFPKVSPDGKWIVFCQAASFMLLQPDSELYIVPSDGGDARRLACNLPRMNSWHSWAPNSRWLVFSSKLGTPYTRLFLTHMDETGNSSPAVVLSHFTSPNRAANIPEFVNLKAGGIRKICARFIDDISFIRAGNAFREGGEYVKACEHYKKALALNPENSDALVNLGTTLSDMNRLPEAADWLQKALKKAPSNAVVWYNLSILRAKQGAFDDAIRLCAESVRLDPASASSQSNLGIFLLEKGRLDEALAHLCEAVRLDPGKANTYFSIGRIMVRKGRLSEAARCYSEAARLSPDENTLNALAWLLATAPDPNLRDGKRAVELSTRLCELTRYESARALDILGASYAEEGVFPAAVRAATKAHACALKQGNQNLAYSIGRRLDLYRQGKAFHQ